MSDNGSVTLLMSEALLGELERFYGPYPGTRPSPYMVVFVKGEGFTIAGYAKRVGDLFRVLFQGKKATEEATIWIAKGAIFDPKRSEIAAFPSEKEEKAKKEIKKSIVPDCLFPQIGSDEVGTGDYFGPIIVVASYVKKSDLGRLKELGVTDSKKMSDAHILEIGPSLIEEFPYSQLCLDNKKYNEVYQRGINMNAMKAKMHNRALGNLVKKYPSAYRYMDEFAAEGLYYSYLRKETDVVAGILFSTKGELHYPSVALSSVIARYSFLRHMELLSKNLSSPLPLGAGKDVDHYAKEFLKEHSLEELDAISKANFANRKKILDEK